MDNDNPLLQKAADLYRGLRFTMKYRGVDILPAAAQPDPLLVGRANVVYEEGEHDGDSPDKA